MDRAFIRSMAITKLHALVGWALCGAVMFVGRAVTTPDNALIAHLVAAPIIFWAVSSFYFRRFDFFSALEVAAIFLGVVVFLDLVIVALLVEKSLDMFTSPVGTWIPFALIFIATYLTGRRVRSRR